MIHTTLPLYALLTALLLLSLISNKVAADNQLETLTVTASRDKQALEQLASSLSVIVAQQLQQVSAVHISESLNSVAGVWVSRGNGQEHLTAIRSPVLTGAGSCSAFYIAEDGVPVRPVGFCNVNQLIDINTEQAQQIEVLRGPGTALHGSGALHGVINVLSSAPSKAAEQSLSIEGGPHDYARIKYSASNTLSAHSYRIAANGAHDAGYKNAAGFAQQKLSVRHDYNVDTLSARTLISFSNLNQETAGYITGFNAYKNSQQKKLNPNPEAYRDSQSVRVQTRIEQHLDNGSVLIVTPYARYSDMHFLMHFLPGTPEEKNGQRSMGVQTAFSRQVSDTVLLTHGFDAEYTDAWLEQSQQGGFSSFPAGKQYDYEVIANVLAVFINGRYTLSPSTTLSTGLRYESLAYDYDNRMITGNTAEDGTVCINNFTAAPGCRYSRPADRRDKFEHGSLTAGLVHQINDHTSIIGRLAHGLRAPQAAELYRLQAGQLIAKLDSEEINSVELGLRGRFRRFSYRLTSFFMEKNNVIFQASDRRNLDDGQTRHQGVEYELSWPLNSRWEINAAGTIARHIYTKNVQLFSSSATININANDIDTSPRHMGTVRLNWHITPGTRATLEWVHMGKYYTDIDNLHSYEGHELFNLRAKHQLTPNLSLGLRITNLTDTDYAERADFSQFSGDRYFVGEPRSVFADISLTF